MSRGRPSRPRRSSGAPAPPRARWSRAALVASAVLAVGLVLVAGTVLWRVRSAGISAGNPVAAPSSPPSIVLVTLDTTRADRLGSYGYAAADTPNLDRLARDGVRFARALSPVPLTLPAHASLMTGRQPFSHGVRNNGHFVLPEDVPTLAAALSSRGYETAAVVSSFVLDRQFGLARGFGHYDDGLDEPAGGAFVSLELERRGDHTMTAVRAWIDGRSRRDHSRPFFLWVHLYDAHEPYAPPSPFRERFPDRPYDGELAFQDATVGELLHAVGYGTSDAPMVVVAGDHGESLGEHGESTHGLFVYDAALRVPLIVSWPGVLAPGTVATPVRLVDLAPTLADFAGAGPLDGADGQSLRRLLSGRGEGDEPTPAYAETYFPQFFMQWAPLRAIQAGRWKYIEAPEPELYDLQADPGEQRNLVAAEPSRVTSLKRALEGIAGAGAGRHASTPLTADARERLASLGYVSATAPATTFDAAAALPDPKRMAPLFEQLLAGNRALARGDADGAARLAQGVLAKDGTNAFAHLLAGRAAMAAGRHGEAIARFKAYVALVPGSADAHHWMALAHLRLGDRRRALAEEEAALAIDSGHTAAVSLRAGLLFSTGRKDEGLQLLGDAVRRDPSNPTLRVELADLLTDAGRYADAEGEYRQVIAARPRDSRALLGMGLVLGAMGRPADALGPLNEAVDADPRNSEARFARAEVLEQLGRTADARRDYERVASEAERPDLRQIAASKIK